MSSLFSNVFCFKTEKFTEGNYRLKIWVFLTNSTSCLRISIARTLSLSWVQLCIYCWLIFIFASLLPLQRHPVGPFDRTYKIPVFGRNVFRHQVSIITQYNTLFISKNNTLLPHSHYNHLCLTLGRKWIEESIIDQNEINSKEKQGMKRIFSCNMLHKNLPCFELAKIPSITGILWATETHQVK